MNDWPRRARGFSLLELVVALAILGLLVGMAAPLTETVIRRGKEQELKNALYRIRDAIDAYKEAADAGFIEKSALGSGYPPSLEVLVEGVRDQRNPSGSKLYFLRRIPRDPFAEPGMKAPESWGLRSYDSSAENPQEGEDVYDVHSLSGGRGLNGIPYREW
ncbi:general secretion pathway protein G [Azotobacter vinelandii CA]|uniref:General secretion pathway protein G n=2 Tax=Azotobacter vinelandii TaxID=354 RepID=C1DLZ1_AZOVD|nr:type II secretion system protein [Azotobacter vinelandii]ACO79078.1 general secretion pathway protein G [Azotobacter vinelandii DJ]AGK16511.1 general secretion pathway protein G [Azotobacter vinelandii CA]AGK20947.1 general secretion pathway protein G [Azotobacter vinelandii CA6]SFX51399.1 general secretion pathway protein G [Azotobacter vinelandii]GLK58994.1 type II secretion system pseudopilin PulG [Azotobacter vinelandii]